MRNEGIDFIGVAVVFLCHDGKGNFLFAKRGKKCRDENGRWNMGSGALEFGERAVSRLKKEVQEEYNSPVLSHTALGWRELHRVHNHRKTHWMGLDFLVRVDRRKVKNNEPHKLDEVQWFRLNALPRPMHSQWRDFIKLRKEKINEICKL
ncbi:NUDIX hydrolase [Patescibacteria group bacterium]|nr:MAG: NUDIX hydrolase [Patescibacteria group bacterium]